MKILPSFLDWYQAERDNLDAVVLDIDGVLIRRGVLLPKADQLLGTLNEHDTPYGILTNSADDSAEERRKTLSDAGLDIPLEYITSSGHSLKPFVDSHNLKGNLFYMIAKLGEPCYAEAAGLRVTADVAKLPECQGVLVGEGVVDWQRAINGVVNFLMTKPKAYLICPNPDLFFPGDGETIVIASGGVTQFIVDICLANGIEISPVYLGKPHPALFEFSHQRLQKRIRRTLRKSRTVMVGDMLSGDIKGANDFGYVSALMLTGGTNRGILSQSDILPDLAFEKM
ncbi:MAG: HAD hydrolase-like protein [Spirochaetales bacterium]|jgi:HAD superfamily hydrolase (TIGR01450 family)|nr:HAD hydrolase-like protein [Spirochaetales bacterium]